MSGGHFDYKQYQIEEIAQEIEELITNNDNNARDRYGDDIGYHFKPETVAKFREAVKTLRVAAVMVQRIDWLVSDDDGEEEFHERWEEEIAKLKEVQDG